MVLWCCGAGIARYSSEGGTCCAGCERVRGGEVQMRGKGTARLVGVEFRGQVDSRCMKVISKQTEEDVAVGERGRGCVGV